MHSFQDEHFVEAMTYVKDFLYREINDTNSVITLQIDNPVMYVNGAEVYVDETGSAPRIVDGRTLLPIRAVVENLGGGVEWNDAEQSATINYNGNTIVYTIGSNTVVVNGQAQTLDSAPELINDRTMIPIRATMENLGIQIEWSDPTRTATIIY